MITPNYIWRRIKPGLYAWRDDHFRITVERGEQTGFWYWIVHRLSGGKVGGGMEWKLAEAKEESVKWLRGVVKSGAVVRIGR